MATTITLDDDVWEKLVLLKLEMRLKTYSEVLRRKLKVIKGENKK